MARIFTLSRFVRALSIGAAIAQPVQADEVDSTAPLSSRMAEIVGFVESALVEPIPDLEERARKGYARDKLMYGLALKAGRMGAGQEKNAKKWIRKAANSFERPTYSQSNLIGPAVKTRTRFRGKALFERSRYSLHTHWREGASRLYGLYLSDLYLYEPRCHSGSGGLCSSAFNSARSGGECFRMWWRN